MVKGIKAFATVVIIALCAIFIIRCVMVADKSVLSDLYATPAAVSVYDSARSDEMVKTVKVVRELAEDGYFAAYALYYIPEAAEYQVSVRWNESVYGYTDIPSGTEFTFSLRDEGTGTLYPATVIDSEEKTIYHYRKLVIPNAALPDENTRLTVVMDLRDGFTSEQAVRYAEQPWEDYRLSRSERALFEGRE